MKITAIKVYRFLKVAETNIGNFFSLYFKKEFIKIQFYLKRDEVKLWLLYILFVE